MRRTTGEIGAVTLPNKTVGRYTPNDLHELMSFRSSMYGPDSILSNPAYVRWMYEQGPGAKDRGPALWLHKTDGTIDGQQGGFRTELKIGESQRLGMWLFDLIVRPSAEGRGVGLAVNAAAYRESEVGLGVEVATAVRAAGRKFGWKDLGTVPLQMRPLDLTEVVRARWDSPLAAPLLLPLRATLRAAEVAASLYLQQEGAQLEEVSRFDLRSEAVWKSASLHYPVLCRRDTAYLNWRFADFPVQNRYRLFYVQRRGETVGYVVLRTGEHRGLSSGFVVDFLCEPKWIYLLFAASLRWMREQEVKAVYCIHHSRQATLPLRGLGFVPRDSGWPMLLNSSVVSRQEMDLMAKFDNWFFTAGDSDIDRPRENTVFRRSR